MEMRGGSTSLPVAPHRNTPTSQAAATTAEPMIQRDWRALAPGKARIPIYKPSQTTVEDTVWTMITIMMSDIAASFRKSVFDFGHHPIRYRDNFLRPEESHCCAPGPISALSGIKGPTGMYW